MRIYLLLRSLDYGGAQRQAISLANGLHACGHQITILTYYSGGQMQAQLDPGVNYYSAEKRGRWDIGSFIYKLVKKIRQEEPDILHSYLIMSNVLTALLKPFLKKTRLVWGVRSSNVSASPSGPEASLLYNVEPILARKADLVIFNSQAGERHALSSGFRCKRRAVIYNGIDTEYFKPDPLARRAVRTEWRIAPGNTLIGLVGRLDPIKDHPTFIQAARLLTSHHPDMRFVCIGGGSPQYEIQLRSLSGPDTNIIWAGSRRDMPAVCNALDILVSASTSEGFPNVIAEAMSCNVPCVVTDAGDSALIVGTTGIVCPVRRPDLLASGIDDMARRIQSGQKPEVRQRILDEFSTSRMIRATEDALFKLMRP